MYKRRRFPHPTHAVITVYVYLLLLLSSSLLRLDLEISRGCFLWAVVETQRGVPQTWCELQRRTRSFPIVDLNKLHIYYVMYKRVREKSKTLVAYVYRQTAGTNIIVVPFPMRCCRTVVVRWFYLLFSLIMLYSTDTMKMYFKIFYFRLGVRNLN